MDVLFDSARWCKINEHYTHWREHKSFKGRSSVPLDILRQMATSPDPEVRIGVADSGGASANLLLSLCDDPDADVRYAIAENHNICSCVLSKLMADGNPYVADRARRTLIRTSKPIRQLLSLKVHGNASKPCSVIDSIRPDSLVERECRLQLAKHDESGGPDNMALVILLQSLSQALEGQGKFAEGYLTRLRVRDALINMMVA